MILLFGPVLYFWVTIIVSAASWFFSRKKREFHLWDLALIVVPLLLWFAVANFRPGKSIANLMMEPYFLAAFVSVVIILRSVFSKNFNRKTTIFLPTLFGVIFAILLALLFPGMQE